MPEGLRPLLILIFLAESIKRKILGVLGGLAVKNTKLFVFAEGFTMAGHHEKYLAKGDGKENRG